MKENGYVGRGVVQSCGKEAEEAEEEEEEVEEGEEEDGQTKGGGGRQRVELVVLSQRGGCPRERGSRGHRAERRRRSSGGWRMSEDER